MGMIIFSLPFFFFVRDDHGAMNRWKKMKDEKSKINEFDSCAMYSRVVCEII